MLLLMIMFLAVLIGLARGGRLDGFSGHQWRMPVLPFLAIVLQVIAFAPDESASAAARTFTASLHLLSYLATFIFFWLNRRTPWIWLVACGALSNALAIIANGGFMPVSTELLLGTPHDVSVTGVNNNSVQITEATRLAFLGDIFPTPSWLPFQRALSIGDLVIAAGVFGVVLRLMPPRNLSLGAGR